MGLEVKATCDKGAGHPAPFFHASVRLRQLHSGKTSSFDRSRILGVFCAECLRSGAIRLSLPSFENDGSKPVNLRESCGTGAGRARE